MCWANVIAVSIDRYVAIIHPLTYEVRLTYEAVKAMLAVAWITAILLASTFWFWFINADMKSCSIVPVMYQAFDAAVYILTSLVLIFVYGSILRVALQQRAKVRAEAELALQLPSCSRPAAADARGAYEMHAVSSSLNFASTALGLQRHSHNYSSLAGCLQ